jgi:hypothetical protein
MQGGRRFGRVSPTDPLLPDVSTEDPMSEAVGSVMQAEQVALATQVQMAVARKVLDSQASQGEAVVQLLKAAAQISRAAGLGERFDAIG